MKLSKKVTDFIVLDEGNIGHKAAVVTGALLTSSVLGAVLTIQTVKAWDHCDNHANEHYACYGHNQWVGHDQYPHCESHNDHDQCV